MDGSDRFEGESNTMSRKVAFVTGASNVTGRAIAIAFAKAGYDVGFTYTSNEDGAIDTLKAIEAEGAKGKYYYMNIRNIEPSKATLREFAAEFGPMDVMINNTGITTVWRMLDVTEEDFNMLSEINIRGTYFMMQEAAKIMIEGNKKGCIINITSVHAEGTFFGSSVYALTKAAISRMTKSCALELAPYGINVNAFAPGHVNMLSSPNYTPERIEREKEAYAKIAEQMPLHRWQDPNEEIGKCIVFLASDAARFIVGQTIMAEGGVLIPMTTDLGWENKR